MWALRRASTNPVKAQGLNLAAFRAYGGFAPFSSHIEDRSRNCDHANFMLDRWHTSKSCHCTAQIPDRFPVWSRSLSSHAGAKSGGEEEDDLEDGFSELETPEASETTGVDHPDDEGTSSSESESESELSGDDESLEDGLETELMTGTEVDAGDLASKKKRDSSALLNLVLNEKSTSDALNKYAGEQKDLSRSVIYYTLLSLRRRKLFVKALELSEWLEKYEKYEFVERDYASRVDLIAKVRGFHKAENYIDNIPKSYRQEVVYRTLLANCAGATNVKKAEEVFNKMKDLGFPLSAFACNQLLILYKRTDKKKIADVLLMMEKENIKPTLFTYQILIDTKGQSNDMAGMDKIVETMEAEGIKPNIRVKASLARHYASGGLKAKAEEVLKDMEGNDLKDNRWICPILLPIYADLGKADDVERVWKVIESKPRQQDFLAAIEAWGKLKNIEKAEVVFKKMSAINKKLTTTHYSIMLRVYADNKMLSKGKELLKQMGDSGCHIGPFTWDALVKLYVDAGEVEKADSMLQKAAQQNQKRPLFSSYMAILDQYAKRGDIHNAEKIFHRMRQAGYVARAKPFQALLNAYINGKVPAYGIRERMKADNIFPNKGLASQLAMVDAFRKTPVSDLLD